MSLRWEEQSLQRTRTKESIISNVFQRLGKSNESKGITKPESPPFYSLDAVAHTDRNEMSTLIESLTLDDCDAFVDNNMSGILGNSLFIETCKATLYFDRNIMPDFSYSICLIKRERFDDMQIWLEGVNTISKQSTR